MPYTLLKFLLWFGLAALIGGVVGWLLRSLKCRAEVVEARTSTVDGDDVERMRHRLANLEQVVAERDRLRMQVADLRAADSPGVVGAVDLDLADEVVVDDVEEVAVDAEDAADDAAAVDEAEAEAEGTGDADDDAEQDAVEDADVQVDDAGDPTDDDAPSIVPDDAAAADDVEAPGAETIAGFASTSGTADDAPTLDLVEAATVLGKKIKLDDLTAVEGIGPKISELCRGIGIDTWQQLGEAEVADLRSMLDAAGPRYQIHKPDTWPRQAELLATGQWDAFKALVAELDGGR